MKGDRIQEIVTETKPDIILEIGVAWAGTLLLYDTLASYAKIKKIIGVDIFIPSDLKRRIFSKSHQDMKQKHTY